MEQPKELPDQKPPQERKRRGRWPLFTLLILLLLLLLSLRACSYVKEWRQEVTFSDVKTLTEDFVGRAVSRIPFIGKKLAGTPALTGESAVGSAPAITAVSGVSGGQAVTGGATGGAASAPGGAPGGIKSVLPYLPFLLNLNLGADFLKGLQANFPVVIDSSSGSALASSSSGSRGQGALILSATLRNRRGKLVNPKIRFSSGGVVVEPDRKFTPGLYLLKVTATNALSGEQRSTEQDYGWGVVAMNPNQDRYRPGETVKLSIGVLDERGAIVCNADLTLIVRSPSGRTLTLSTADNSIQKTGTCGRKEAGLISPDYAAFFVASEEGSYDLTLDAVTRNGHWTIGSTVPILRSPAFVIERRAATRLWPFAPSPMEITVRFNEDFSGIVTETVPAGFILSNISPSYEEVDDTNPAGSTISWRGSWRAGQTETFRYDYDAPDESPQFFLVGPLELTAQSFAVGRPSRQLVDREMRSWQIANDADSRVYWIGTNVAGSDSWSDTTKWSLSSGGSSCSCTPGANDVATFDGARVGNVVVDVNVNVLGVDMQSGYTGTVSQSAGRTITAGADGWTQANGTFTGGNSSVTVNGTFSLSGGSHTATLSTTSVQGNFYHAAGTFTHNSGTVQLTGTRQTLSGSTTFNNLTKTIVYADTLYFQAGATQTVAGTLTLKGVAGSRLSLRSTLSGTQWNINPQAGRVISYLDVQDSNNANATVIDATNTNSISSGNNTNWNFGWNSGDWLYRKKITISNTNVDANLTNFPLYVKVSNDANIGPRARSDGYDIRFTDSGGTLIPYERENYSYGTGSGSGNFWVKVPLITSASPTYIFIYYGNSSAGDGSTPNSVWDSNFKGVYHMSESSGNINDSTSNGNTASVTGSPTYSTSGQIGKSIQTGVGNYFTINSAILTGTPVTLSAWFNSTDATTEQDFIGSFNDANNFLLAGLYTGKVYVQEGNQYITGSSYGINAWHMISAVLNNDSLRSVFYDGGNKITQTTSATANSLVKTGIGVYWNGSSWLLPLRGKLDEVRFSSTVRSDAWIKFEYCNMGGGSCTNYALTWEGQAAGQQPPAEAQTTGYNIRTDVVAAGGGEKAKSSNYFLDDTIGEANIGLSKTANYSLNAGYRQAALSGPYISLSCSSTVTLPSIAPGSQSTGSGTCIVTTDADAGYNLQWAAQSAGWLSGWSYRKQITISKTNVDSALTDFPFLVKITNDTNIGPNARSDGYDIRFTSATGALLRYERESYSYGSGSGSGVFWVKVPVVNSVANTTIYVYYGNSSATTDWTAEGTPTNAQLVWDSNFKGVWHLKETGTDPTVNDSTSNANNSTVQTWTPITSGKVGGAGSFNGSTQYIKTTSDIVLTTSNAVTVESWVNPSSTLDSSSGRKDIIYAGEIITSINLISADGKMSTDFYVDSADLQSKSIETSWTGGTWYHIVSTYSKADSKTGRFYLNGIADGTAVAPGTGDVTNNNYIPYFGRQGLASNYYWPGLIDEVRISSTARSAAWIKFEYNNMNSVGNEATWSGQQTQGTDSANLVSQYGDTIVPYTPAASGVPETWSVAVADSEWGGRLRADSTDIDSKWGTEGGSKWLNIPTTNYTVVTRNSRTNINGSTEILHYRVEIGSSHLQPTGKYSATVTMTAVAL